MAQRTTVLLVRHGKAELGAGKSDAERHLTDEGVAEVRAAAAAVGAGGLRLDAVLTSPLPRARETAAVLAAELAPGQEPIDDEALAPGALADGVVEAVWRLGEGMAVGVVGHAPDLSGIAAALVAPGGPRATGFTPGGMCCIDFDGPVALGAGRLRWAHTCAELAAGGPGAG